MLAQLLMISSLLAQRGFITNYNGYIYTPKGTKIECGFFNGDVNYYLGTYDWLYDEYKGVQMRAKSNPIYNCFSYAFYKTSSNNNCVIKKDVTSYRTDGSYIQSQGYPGDKIVYFDVEGNPMHAGVVIARTSYPILEGTDDLANVLVDSKRDEGPLYRHSANNCPYSHVFNNFFGFFKYYRLNDSHAHSFNYSIINSNTNEHLVTCACGMAFKQPHHFYFGTKNYDCIYCSSTLKNSQEISNLNIMSNNSDSQFLDNKIFLNEKDYLYLKYEANHYENI